MMRHARFAAPALLAVSLAACQSSADGSNTLTNFLYYGGPTVPTPAPPPVDEIDCPQIDIFEGGAAIRTGGERASRQISITNIARECTPSGGGAYTMKIGIEGLALLGPGGTPGTTSVPVRVIVKSGSRIIASRVKQVSVSIPAGTGQGRYAVVESGIVIPAGVEPDVQVGLGGSGPAAEQPARRRRAGR